MSRGAQSVGTLLLSFLSLCGSATASDPALVDPTRPPGWGQTTGAATPERSPGAQALKLQGVINVAGRRSALISGERVGVGDFVAGARVVEIGRQRVTVQVDGELVELAGGFTSIKVPSDSAARSGANSMQHQLGPEK